ncbi:MAG: dethiobiotin synthase [Pirellulaceae bacterium]|nr:dethiobiotin synthase [Pirellulaceae bacterium]
MKRPLGLFVTGTDTGVGKTTVAAAIARQLAASGCRVGVYKPVASGCRLKGGKQVSDDALQLWEAAGRPLSLPAVCPQVFLAPLAPHLAARQEGCEVDADLLRRGADTWRDHCELLIVEGAGGLMTPLTDDEYVADLAYDLGYPLIVVAPNVLGVINQTLQTLIAAATFREGLEIAGIVLNDVRPPREADASSASNLDELRRRCIPPVLGRLAWRDSALPVSATDNSAWVQALEGRPVDWRSLAAQR